MKIVLTACLVFVLPQAKGPKSPLQIVVVPNRNKAGGKQSRTGLEPHQGGIEFEVVLTNISDRPLSVWK